MSNPSLISKPRWMLLCLAVGRSQLRRPGEDGRRTGRVEQVEPRLDGLAAELERSPHSHVDGPDGRQPRVSSRGHRDDGRSLGQGDGIITHRHGRQLRKPGVALHRVPLTKIRYGSWVQRRTGARSSSNRRR